MASPNASTHPKDGETPAASPCPDKCPLCGGPNDCAWAGAPVLGGAPASSNRIPCWCFMVEVPSACAARASDAGRSCICHACVAEARRSLPWDSRPRAGETYWLEDGRMAFTARYHLRRGYCCGNGCRHCPYDDQGRPRRDVMKEWVP